MYLTYIPTYTCISSPNFNLKCLFLKLTGFPVMIGFPVRYVTIPSGLHPPSATWLISDLRRVKQDCK